ncbi:MAG: helix-turn-helix transcriptional regulator [Candidatus Thermoplasmatota archaeon]|nr:helix-turn-helix transcriptional regulator [Candidatus Thermoplasmatota archaeon]
MNALAEWLQENGAAGRRQLFEALKREFPKFSQTSISQYKHGKRLPDRRKAEIIAEILGVNIDSIPHRLIHRPS